MTVNFKLLSLYVEGPDDGTVVNALAKERLGHDLSLKDQRIVKLDEKRPGFENAVALFKSAVLAIQRDGRVGLMVDRDRLDEKKDRWSSVRAALQALSIPCQEAPPQQGLVADGPRSTGRWPSR